MALVVKTKLNLSVMDKTITLFSSGDLMNTIQTLNQDFGGDFSIPNGTTDMKVSFDGATQANQIFLLCDQSIDIKLVSQGQTVSSTQIITLYAALPSLLSVKNVVEIYVSNSTGTDAQLILEGIGA